MLKAKFSISAKPFRAFQFKPLSLLLVLAVMFGSAASSFQTFGGQTPGQTLVFPTSIQWNKQRGVTRYRLQIGGDDTFQNIYHDRRVMGGRYRVSGLPPGSYYWRVASADNQLGAFSKPVRFFVSGGVVTSSSLYGESCPVRSTVFRRALSRNTRLKAVLQTLPTAAIAFTGAGQRR